MMDWLHRNSTVTREASVQTPLRLDVQTANGRVRVRGVPGSTATVRAEIDRHGLHSDDGREAAEMVAEGIVFEGARLRIESPASGRRAWRHLRVEYEVSVPFATLAHLVVANGPVDLGGIEGPVEVTLANGPLDIEEVGGAIEVQLANGPAHIQRCRGRVDAMVANGPLRIDSTVGPLDLKVHNGPIDLADVGAGIEANVSNGPISYRGPVAGDFDLRSDRGPIVLALPGDSRFELDAEAERGEVHCDFRVNQGAGPSTAPVPRVVLRSRRGEIRLQPIDRRDS